MTESAQRATRKPWPTARRRRTRAKLVEAAYRLMSKAGVEATSLLEITAAAGVGAGTFYGYFASKEDIASQVLDCLIENLARRTGAAVQSAHSDDPLAAIAISVRGGLRDLLTNRLWYWWLKHPELLVARTRLGFREAGEGDLRRALHAGRVRIPGGDIAAAWSMLIWQMVAGVCDIQDGTRAADTEPLITESILQALGVAHDEAARLARADVPAYPDLPVDFAFVLDAAAEAAS